MMQNLAEKDNEFQVGNAAASAIDNLISFKILEQLILDAVNVAKLLVPSRIAVALLTQCTTVDTNRTLSADSRGF